MTSSTDTPDGTVDTTDEQEAAYRLQLARRTRATDARALARPLGWGTASPQPTLRGKKFRPERTEHLQRAADTITWTRRQVTPSMEMFSITEKPTVHVIFNHLSGFQGLIGAEMFPLMARDVTTARREMLALCAERGL